MTPVIHNYSQLAGKTVHWDTMDNQEWYQKNIKNPKAHARLVELGFLDTKINYRYNSHGFRTAEFDRPIDIVCFGCSFTLGTGVHESDTWPGQLQSLTGMQVANLGHSGSSNDTAFRFAAHYLPLLKPKYAVWLQTDMHRVELLDDSIPISMNMIATDTHNPCANDYFIKTWFSSVSNQQLNLQKNTLAFNHLCDSLDIISVIIPREQLPDQGPFPNGGARDLTHPGAGYYKELAQQITTVIVGPTNI
jgi:hypothetical protein